MKKTLQLLALLALLCVPWVGRAQLDVTVADGTVTNNYVPVYGLYCDDYQKAHFVYPAELLDEMTSGSQISQMVFYLQNVPNAAWTGLFNIYLTEVNDASISAFADVSTMQQVYTGTLDATSGTMTVEFVSNYTYNGGNLLIAFEEYQNGNYKAAGFYGITSTGSSVSGYNGSSLASVTSATQRNFLPKVTFSYIPGGGAFCAKPATLNVFDITSEGASFSWSGTEAGLYQFETKTAADSIWSIWAPQTDTSFVLFSLDPNTAYNARVKALCSDSLESGYKTVNFRTACAPISLPYVMGFEDGDLMGTSTSMEKFPWCWTRINDATSSTYNYYPVCNNSSSYVHTGSRYLQFTGGTSASYPEVQVAVLPPLDVTLYPMNANRITFWGRSSSASYNKVVYIGTMSDPTDFNTFVLIDSVVVSGTTYTKYAVPLANANATDAYVAIWAQKSNGTLYVDDVTLEELPSCLEVVSVAVDAASSNSITLSWLPNEANTNASYSIYIVGGDGSNTLVASGITDTSYTIMGLDANTPYTFAVQTNCPAGDAAMISVSGRTACVPLSEDMLPYVEDFEEYGTGSSQPISPCWRKGTNGTTAYPYPYSSAAINGNRGLYFYGYHPSSATSTMTYCWAALPPVDESVDMSNLMVTFNAKRYSSTSATYHSTIMVGIAESVEALTSAGAIDSMVTWMGSYDLTPEAAGTIVEERVSFANYQGNGKYVVFYCPSPELGSGSYAYNYIYIDDVVLRNIPTCPDVTGLIASDVTAESVTLTWDYDADTYTLYNIADGSVLGTVTDTAYTIAGLVPTTNYTFGVAANCGSDQGQMATVTFRTTGIPISLPYATGFEDGEDQGWEFVNGSNGWTIGSATSNFGTNALYISNDNGVSNSYTLNTASTSYAYRTIQIEQPGQYTVSFNWKGNGESSYDFLRAWLAPASFQFTANAYPTTSGSYNGSYSPDGWYGLGGKMNLQSEWQIFSQIIEVTEPGNYNLVFMWRNDNSGGNQPPIAVDNVSIDQITCPAPINLTATTTATEATITWQSLGYESVWYVYSESDGEVYWTSTPSFTMTGLMPMTSYSVAVAANCGDSNTSVWTSYTFTTLEDSGSDTSFIDCTGNYCNITIVGSDSYGDGWNGNAINVVQGGNTIGTFTIESGFSFTSEFNVCSTLPVSFYWVNGNYANETSFQILDGGGTVVYTGSGAQSENIFTLDNACPSCLPVNGLTVTSTTNSATLYWGVDTIGSNVTYNIYMDSTLLASGVSDNYYVVNNLASNTEYTFGVQVVCSADDVSSLATVSVRTACDGISQQTYEDEACGIYYFDGYTFTESGIYGDTIYDEYGCMVARTLVLTIHPEYYDTIQATATNYYVWYGDTLTGDGLYPHIEYTIDGCDSIEFLMLSVNYTMDCGEGVSSVTVKNADASDAVNSYVPGYSYYNNSYSEVIIPADRLEGIGTIKALQFKPANTNGGTYFTNCEVYLANTSDDNLSAGFTADRSSFQQVWSGDMSYTSADWQTLMFTTPFVWDGTSNIVVAVIRNHGSYANGSSFEAYTADAQLARYVYNDNNQYNISAVSDGTASNTPAWYKLLGCNDGAVITCARVRDQYADATSNSVTLHWSDPTNTVATYNVYNITNTDTILVASNISDTLYVVNNLESNTPYVFGIEANCGTGDVSTMARVSVRTQCDAISTLPYTMDFEAQNLQGTTNALAFPWCWTRINNLSTGYYIDYPYVSQYSSGYNSTNALQFYYYSYGSDTANTVMGFVLPALDIETYPMNGNRISFWAKGESWNSNTYSLQVGTMSNPADMSTFTPVETVTVDATEYTKYTVSLANANSTNAYVAVMASSPNGTMYLDDLTLEVLPACADITGLTLVNVTENSATISWDAVADSYTVLMNGSEISVIDTTYTFTDLMPMTQYTISVAANCGSNLGAIETMNFNTACSAVSLPYVESFDETSALRDCWTLVASGNIGGSNGMGYATINNHTTLRFSSYSNASDYNQYGYSPVFTAPADAENLSVSITYATNGSNDQLNFGYIVGNDTVWDETLYTTGGNSDWQTYTTVIPATASQIAIHYYGNYSYYGWIDNVTVSEATTVVDATISADEIIYWVGSGSNEAILAVNWADTALAWGYRWNGDATVSSMMTAIANDDPRFSYEYDGWSSMSNIMFNDGEVSLSTPYNDWWWINVNGSGNNGGMGQTLYDGNFVKWGLYSVGVAVDSAYYEGYGYANELAFPMTVYPVSEPDDTIYMSATACDSYTWRVGDQEYNLYESGVWYQYDYNTGRVYFLDLTINQSSETHLYDTAYGMYVDEWGYGYNYDYEYENWYTNAEGCDSIVWHHITVLPMVNEEPYVVSSCGCYWTRSNNLCESGTYNNVEYYDENDYLRVGTLVLTVNENYYLDTTVVTTDSYYVFNGDTLTQSGWYESFNTRANGCDSIIYLHLQMLTGETQYVTACDEYCTENGRYCFNESGEYVVERWNDSTYESYLLNLTINHSSYGDIYDTAYGKFVLDEYNYYNYDCEFYYTMEGANAVGCDSIVYLHVTVLPIVNEETVVVSACDYYGTRYYNYSESGVYENVVYVDEEGNLRIGTVDLTINHSYSFDTTIVTSESFYVWNGDTLTQSGWYSSYNTTVGGCDSTYWLHLQILNGETQTVTACDYYYDEQWNYYGESGVYVVDRWNDSTYVSYILNLTINHSQRVDTTIVFDGNPVVWNGQVYTEPGYYTYTTTGSNGCDSTQQLHLVTIQEVTIDMTGDGYLFDYTNQMQIHNDTTIVYEGEGGCYQLVTFVPSEGEYYNVAGEFCRVVSVALDGESLALDNIKVYEGMGSSGYIIYDVCIPNDGANHTLNVVYGPYYDETSCNSMYNMHVTDPFDTTAWVNWVAGVGTHTYEVSYGLYDEFNADSLTFSGNYTTVNVTSYDTNISYQLTGLQMNTHYAVIVKMFCENGGWWYYWNGFWTSGAPHSITFSNNGGAVSGELWGRDTTITYNYYEGWSYGTYLYSLSNEWADEYEVARNRRELHQVIVDGQSLNLNGDSTASYQFMPSSVEEDITGYYFRINYDADHTVQFIFGPGAGDVVYDTVMLNQTVCGSFAWELSGETYTQSGVYMYTVVSENVETTYILNLTVNNATNNLYTETACDSYIWNNTPYSVSGSYTYSYTNEAGCASVDTLQLTINQSTTGSEVVTACNSYVWHGREFFAATDTATYTTVNANGCDSTVTLHLTINQCSTTEITACDSYIWHGIPYTNSGVFSYGNDTLVLTINRSTRGIEVATACNSYQWHGNLYTESTITTDTTENVAGCDSITTLYLTVNQCSTEEVTACDSYEWNNLLLTSSGVYTLGNDTLILTINRSTRGIEVVNACNSYEWHGTVYTSSINNVTYTTTNAVGCDSVATLYLTVNQCSTTDAVACDSYQWNGSVYNASGTYIIGNDTLNLTINRSNFGDTIAQVCGSFNWYEHTGLTIDTTVAHHFANYNQAGCDSIVTLHLTVFSCSTTEATACESYRWHGNTYTSSGIYRIDHDTLILTINRASHGDTIARACGSFDWYEHLGMTTDTTVDHAFVGTGSNHCDSVVTLHLIVNDCSTTEAVACDSYLWEKNGQTYTSSGIFRDGYDTLRLTINRANHKDIFVTSCGNYDWYEYSGLNQSMTVDHTFPGGNQYGCDSIVSLHLTITQCTVEHVTACNIYVWHNMPFTSSGTYVYGSDTLHLTISRRTLGDTLAIAYGSFDWYGNHITATGTYDHTLIGANQYGCDSTISLLAIILEQPSNVLPSKDVPEIVYYTGCDTVFIPYGNTQIPITTSRSIPSILTGDSIVVTVNHSSTGDTIAQACGSFLWYQHSLSESSTVTHTFAGANHSSCDSVVTLHLTINQCSTLDTTVCGQFTWHGQTFRSSTLWNDGNDTLRLTVNQPSSGDTTAEACGSFDWYEHLNVTQSGNLTHLFTNAAGCDSTVTLHLTINQCSKTDTTVCGSYTWNGHLYRSSGTYHDGNDTLVLNVKQKSTGDTLVTVCGSYDWYEHQNVTESGDLTHLFTNAVGCDSTVTLHLTVNSCSTTHVEACGTYVWKGSSYNASGRYIIGADTLNLTIKEQPTGDTTAAVCGGLSWYEHGFLSESTTVTHAFEKAFGCDSIVTLHLTVYQCSTTEENTCDSYEWHSNVYDQSGTFVDGYDTLRLTIRRSSVGVETATACNMYSWYGRIFTESTDTATRVVSNTVGCDSVITLHLTVNQCSSTDLTVCDSVTWHGVLYTQSGTFFDGHDTLHLTVNNSTTGVETVTACNSYDWYEHTGITASCYNLTHTFVAGNQYGCDSIVTLNLTINQCSRTEVTECDSYVWRGTTYTQSGTYTDGNDTLVLTINHSVATEQNVTANNSYTWHGQTYTQSGDYTWEGTTVAGCDSTVTLHLTINNGIDDVEEAELNVSIYPNPTHGLVNIEANGNVSKVEVYDINGRKVAIYDNTTIIDLSNMASGTYTMRIHTQLGTTIKRVILK